MTAKKKLEWRRPFWIAVPKQERATMEVPMDGNWPTTKGIIPVVEKEIDDKKHSFKIVNSDLLIAIDNDSPKRFISELKQTNINVNQPYVIPNWEVPEACPWPGQYIESFLNRAVESNSQKVFDILLAHGANPRAKNYLGHSVLEQVFDSENIDSVEKIQMGLRLVDAGLTKNELLTEKRKAIQNKDKENNYLISLVYDYAIDLEARQSIKKIAGQTVVPNLFGQERIRV